MKIGLIARCEIARGIAIQTKNFYDNMPVDRVLLVRMRRPDCVEEPDWYDARIRTDAPYNDRDHQLNEQVVRDWLEPLDVVFAVEAPMDWRMPQWCRDAGVKLIIQGNPEFTLQSRPDSDRLHPDAWWWPTSWKPVPTRPDGPIMPVPMPDFVPVHHDGNAELPLRVVHVIGKRAHADRNGSDLFFQALRHCREPMAVTVYALDGATPAVQPNNRVTMKRVLHTVEDRWSMYDRQDVLVIPRRYGGLCLPALEARVCGLQVMMPDCSPNHELANWLVPIQRQRNLEMACGRITTHDVNPRGIAAMLDSIARNRYADVPEPPLPIWREWRPRYLDEMEKVCNSS